MDNSNIKSAEQGIPTKAARLMDPKSRLLAQQWSASLIALSAPTPLYQQELNHPIVLVAAEDVVTEIINCDAPLFSIDHSAGPDQLGVSLTPLADRLVWVVSCDLAAVKMYFGRHKLSPKFELLRSTVNEWPGLRSILRAEDVDGYNRWVRLLRERARSEIYADLIAKHARTSRANTEGLSKRIRSLHRKKSTLLVIRMLLGRHLESWKVDDSHRSPIDAQREFGKLLRTVSRKFENLVWYSWRLEHSSGRSYHHQLMLVFRGPDVGDDIGPGRVVQELWSKQCKQGDGIAIVCNSYRHLYEPFGMAGLGTITPYDKSRHADLESAAVYMAKAGAYAKLDVGVRKTYSSAQVNRSKPNRRSARKGVDRPFLAAELRELNKFSSKTDREK